MPKKSDIKNTVNPEIERFIKSQVSLQKDSELAIRTVGKNLYRINFWSVQEPEQYEAEAVIKANIIHKSMYVKVFKDEDGKYQFVDRTIAK